MHPGCWVAFNVANPGHCSGRLVRAHLIKQQTIRRKAPNADVWDPRVWVPMCGGATGIGGHHGLFDHSRHLRIPREALPSSLEEFAAEHSLLWYLDREFGPLGLAA